jgi:hypothetical protein
VYILERYFASKLFVAVSEHLAMRILTRESQIRQQYAGWQQNFETQDVFVCDKRSSSDKASEVTSVRI